MKTLITVYESAYEGSDLVELFITNKPRDEYIAIVKEYIRALTNKRNEELKAVEALFKEYEQYGDPFAVANLEAPEFKSFHTRYEEINPDMIEYKSNEYFFTTVELDTVKEI